MKQNYKLIVFSVMFLITLSNLSFSQTLLDKTLWKPVFIDDFNYPTSQLSQNWEFTFNGYNTILNTYCPQSTTWNDSRNVSTQNGICRIHISDLKNNPISAQNSPNDPVQTFEFSSAILRSKFIEPACIGATLQDHTISGYEYGMFEIRCKLPQGDAHHNSGLYPAFWMAGHNSWPPEIDAFEYNTTKNYEFFSTVHWQDQNVNPNFPYEVNCGNFYYRQNR